MIQDKESFKKAYLDTFSRVESNPLELSNNWEKYHALVSLVKEMMNSYWVNAVKTNIEKDQRRIYYLSMEFLIGKMLAYNLMNLGLENIVREGLADLNINYDELLLQEEEAPLGNGGLGRLAACYLDSMAQEKDAGYGFGFGIRYKYGLFTQKIVDGCQVEVPDPWLKDGYVWATPKPDRMITVKFKGNVRTAMDGNRIIFIHENYEPVLAVPHDILFLGYMDTSKINYLRLYSAEPVMQDFDLLSFNQGEFAKAAAYRAEVEAISNILYPEDQNQAGRELRLKQEYFLSAASVGDSIAYYKMIYGSLDKFAKRVAFHINDTHPAVSIPELMRILIDEEGMSWEEAWEITVNVFSYTNHTILPEALECWPVDLFRALLPRIYMIIEEIDRRYLQDIGSRYPGDEELLRKTAIIADGRINMAHLSVIGSRSVNGVSRIHSQILKENIFGAFYKITPEKFHNITNGVSHRRFLHYANQPLSDLISQAIGVEWINQATELDKLLAFSNDRGFMEQLAKAKYKNKERLAKYIFERQGVAIDPSSMFDIHVKRLHGYKRQLLNALKIMDLYNAIKEGKTIQPTTFIFGGKAASSYQRAKDVIKLINSVAQIVNNDKQVNDYIRVVFLENFNVSLGEIVYPAADVSEQISTASKEASGTGCMKFMFNGAITLGSRDGANLEIHEAVGDEHFALFGLTAAQVMELSVAGRYNSWDEYSSTPRLKRVIDQLVDGFLQTTYDFHSIRNGLLWENDCFFVLKDFMPYTVAWEGLNQKYADQDQWLQSSLYNIAKAGIFSSDRAIKEYHQLIWNRKGPVV
ncbi:Glycogen phosphorylase [Sporotomaculum syntrophicum]|uniref:Alpha-1,4 glucan phosphorylase n=1 Tax=Sporotomaculum syntrophicum TaxID=182264 RepID=A0A9D3AZV1_9FIRM|nr:glycogen/starch/alpha-glucan phosphorylase [Sporotomaculum syntrophicum]KAF1086248.1 Glycogen phosphorylase [Sporotomaculum syntrophicum]